MKIAYFTDTYRPEINGVTNTFDYLTAYLDNTGAEYRIFAPDYGSGAPSDAEQKMMRFKGFRPYVNPPSRLAFPNHKTVLNAVTAFAPDIIHILTELGIGHCGLRVARELGIPVVMSYHTNFDRYLKFYTYPGFETLYWRYMKWFHSFASVNLCPSRDTLKDLEDKGFEQLDIWSRGVDLQMFSPSKYSDLIRLELGGREKFLFLYAGRIAREKGLDILMEAIRIVNEKHPGEAVFVFAGDGPYRSELAGYPVPNAVFTGFKCREDLSRIYASCDAFVFPSGTETFGNVALEAMGSGLPVICVDSGGVTDYTEHLTNAWVCINRDAESLARGMTAVLENGTLGQKLRWGALQTAASRRWDRIFDGLMAQYEKAACRPAVWVPSYKDLKRI